MLMPDIAWWLWLDFEGEWNTVKPPSHLVNYALEVFCGGIPGGWGLWFYRFLGFIRFHTVPIKAALFKTSHRIGHSKPVFRWTWSTCFLHSDSDSKQCNVSNSTISPNYSRATLCNRQIEKMGRVRQIGSTVGKAIVNHFKPSPILA